MNIKLLICLVLALMVGNNEAQSPSFFQTFMSNLGQIFRRNSSSNSTSSTEVSTESTSSVATVFLDPGTVTSSYYTTDYSTMTETETELMTVTETSTLTLSWLRWQTLTETLSLTETITETSTTVDVSLLVSVAVVTLTERTTLYSTLTATDLASTTLFFDRTLTSTKTMMSVMSCTPLDDNKHESFLTSEDDALVRNLLLSPTIVETVENTNAPELPYIVKRSSDIESSFTALNTKSTGPSSYVATADLIFTEY